MVNSTIGKGESSGGVRIFRRGYLKLWRAMLVVYLIVGN